VAGAVALGGAGLAAAGGPGLGGAARLEAGPEAPVAAAAAAAAAAPGDGPRALADLGGVPKDLVLYQYEVCPFCCKVKAFLDFQGLPYRTVEVHPISKSQLKFSTKYKKVPVLMADGVQCNDSNEIINSLTALLAREGRLRGAPAGGGGLLGAFAGGRGGRGAAPEPSETEARMRRWVDERFARVVTVNIYETLGESFQTFEYITTECPSWGPVERHGARVVGAGLMYVIAKRMKTKYNLGESRAELFACCDEFDKALAGRRFLAGDKAPGNADLCVFGVLRAVVGTDSFREVMVHGKMKPWFLAMEAAVGKSSRLSQEAGVPAPAASGA